MLVRDFMIQDVISVRDSSTLKELLETLLNERIGGVPVLNGEGKLVGMVGDGDVIRFLKPKVQRIYDFFSYIVVMDPISLDSIVGPKLGVKVDKIMTKNNLFKVTPEDDLEDVMSIFASHHFKKLPVVDSINKVVGVVSRGDIIRQLTKTFILKS